MPPETTKSCSLVSPTQRTHHILISGTWSFPPLCIHLTQKGPILLRWQAQLSPYPNLQGPSYQMRTLRGRPMGCGQAPVECQGMTKGMPKGQELSALISSGHPRLTKGTAWGLGPGGQEGGRREAKVCLSKYEFVCSYFSTAESEVC